MEAHTKIYFKYFGLSPGEPVFCEVCERPCADVHHIESRKMGGRKYTSFGTDVNGIDNLMGVCRECHDEYGDKVQYLDYLREIHALRLKVYHRRGELVRVFTMIGLIFMIL